MILALRQTFNENKQSLSKTKYLQNIVELAWNKRMTKKTSFMNENLKSTHVLDIISLIYGFTRIIRCRLLFKRVFH